MTARWQVLDSECSPKAVFALTYLYMTHGAKQLIADLYFDNGNDMADFVVTFASRYTTAFDNWAAGDLCGVSSPWQEAFSFGQTNMSTAQQDLELGMNAHINYDLAIATYESGYAVDSKKPDYDRVNDLMSDIIYNITVDIGDRYDPSLSPGGLNNAEFWTMLQVIIGWRESAWVDAVTYKTVLGELAGQELQDTYEAAAATEAVAMEAGSLENTSVSRIGYCEAHHAPSRV